MVATALGDGDSDTEFSEARSGLVGFGRVRGHVQHLGDLFLHAAQCGGFASRIAEEPGV
jgi:hypothetical protein